jgi:hypothetical protein
VLNDADPEGGALKVVLGARLVSSLLGCVGEDPRVWCHRC